MPEYSGDLCEIRWRTDKRSRRRNIRFMNWLKMVVRQNGQLRKHVNHWFQTDSSVWSISMKSITYRCHELKMIRVEFGETRTNGPKKKSSFNISWTLVGAVPKLCRYPQVMIAIRLCVIREWFDESTWILWLFVAMVCRWLHSIFMKMVRTFRGGVLKQT